MAKRTQLAGKGPPTAGPGGTSQPSNRSVRQHDTVPELESDGHRASRRISRLLCLAAQSSSKTRERWSLGPKAATASAQEGAPIADERNRATGGAGGSGGVGAEVCSALFQLPERSRWRSPNIASSGVPTACMGRTSALRTARAAPSVHQCAFLPQTTTKTVLIRIAKSSQRLQLLIYHKSSSTRRCILSSVSVSPRAPRT